MIGGDSDGIWLTSAGEKVSLGFGYFKRSHLCRRKTLLSFSLGVAQGNKDQTSRRWIWKVSTSCDNRRNSYSGIACDSSGFSSYENACSASLCRGWESVGNSFFSRCESKIGVAKPIKQGREANADLTQSEISRFRLALSSVWSR